MKKIFILLVIVLISTIHTFAKVTEPMKFLCGPQDGYVYSYDYNPVCGLAAAIVVSEYDYTKNWIPTRTALLVKSDKDSIWKVGMTDVRSDALVRVFDNGIIKARAVFQQWKDTKYEENQWIAYSTDTGVNWTQSEVTWPSQELFASGNTIFRLFNDYLYLSFDNGSYWYQNALPNDFREYQAYIHFSFITVSDSGIVYIQSRHEYYNFYHQDTVYFLKSTDKVNWSNVGFDLREQIIDWKFRSETNFFVITDSTGLIHSADQGNTFQRVALEDKNLLFMKFTDNSRNKLYVANQNEAFLVNAGNFFVTKLDIPGGTITGIAAENNTLFLSILNSGIYSSTDGGKTWILKDRPNRPLAYYCLKVDKNNVIYVLSQGFQPANSYRLYRSSDYGVNWEFMLESDKYLWLEKIHGRVLLNVQKEQKIYLLDSVLTLSFDYSGINNSYQTIMPYGNNSILLDFIGFDGFNYYYKSNDGALTWEKISKPETDTWFDSYFVKDNGDMYFTDGLNYMLYNRDLKLRTLLSPDFLIITERTGDPHNGYTYYDRPSKAYYFKDKKGVDLLFEGDYSYFKSKQKIYISMDSGKTWTNKDIPVYGTLKSNCFIQNQREDIFYTYINGLYKFNADSNSLDKVANYPLNTFVNDTSIDGYAYSNLTMDYDNKGAIIGCLRYAGLFYYPMDSIITIPEPTHSGRIFIYPNPVVDEADVLFSADNNKTIVTIKVYDYIGREALFPYIDMLNKGDYSQTIHLGNLPSGLYFIVVNSGSNISASAVQIKH